MVAWPAQLPQSPLIEGYSEEPQDGVIRTSMSSGRPKTRKRFTAVSRKVSLRFYMTKDQLDTHFIPFFETTIAFGSLPFDFTHWRTGQTIQLKFVGTYSLQSPDGSRYLLSAEFEILP